MNTPESSHCCNCRNWSTFIAALVACLIFVALVWTTKSYTQPAPAIDEARKAERAKALVELRAAEAEALHNVGWIDQAKGVVRLPIADAMRLAEQEWQNPAAARSNLIARVEKATALPPKAPEKPSAFE